VGIKERLRRLEDKANPEGPVELSVCVHPPRCPEYADERKAIAKRLRASRAAGVKILSVRVTPPHGYIHKNKKTTT
jgi:hypothetical protein